MKPGSVLFEFARWAVGLKLEAVPADVREHAKNQVLSIVAAVYSGYASGLGHRIEAAFAPAGLPSDPAAAAFALSAWSMVLDFDDVMLGGHTGHSSVLVPLAFARAGQYTGADVLVASLSAVISGTLPTPRQRWEYFFVAITPPAISNTATDALTRRTDFMSNSWMELPIRAIGASSPIRKYRTVCLTRQIAELEARKEHSPGGGLPLLVLVSRDRFRLSPLPACSLQ